MDEEELKKKHCFKICLKKENARIYYISTDRRIEMEVWMHAIKNARKWYQSDEKLMLEEHEKGITYNTKEKKEKEKEIDPILKERPTSKGVKRGKAQTLREDKWKDKFKIFHNGGNSSSVRED